MKAIVLAGGIGKRLRPLTAQLPKPMVPIVNRPVLSYVFDRLTEAGVTDIFVTTHYQASTIRDYFKTGEDIGVNLHYVHELQPQGTAGSLKYMLDQLDDTFIVMSGDAIIDLDVADVLRFHRDHRSQCTLVLKHVDNPCEFGVVVTNRQNEIKHFIEKPRWNDVVSDLVNTGIYVIEKSAIEQLDLQKISDYSLDIFPQFLAKNIPMYGYQMDGYWSDIGSIDQYFHTNLDVLKGQVLHDEAYAHIGKRVVIGDNVRLEPPFYIGDDVILYDNAHIKPYTIIGDECIIEAATIGESVIWQKTTIKKGTVIQRAVIANDVVVEETCLLDKRVVIGSQAKIGEGVVLQNHVTVNAKRYVSPGFVARLADMDWFNVQFSLFHVDSTIVWSMQERSNDEFYQLALSYAAVQKKGATIVLAFDEATLPSHFIGYWVEAFRSSGIHVVHVPYTLPALVRFAICSIGAAAAITITNMNEWIQLQFVDESGLPLTATDERKIEQSFRAADSHLVQFHEYGGYEKDWSLLGRYRDKLGSLFMNENDEATMHLVVAIPKQLHSFFFQLMKSLPAHWLTVPTTMDDATFQRCVVSTGAAFGIKFDEHGELTRWFSNKGHQLHDRQLYWLHHLVAFGQNDERLLAMRLSKRNYFQNHLVEMKGDPFYLLASIIRLFHERAFEVEEALRTLPHYFERRAIIECQCQSRAAIMRLFYEEFGKAVIHTEDGWKWVLDDEHSVIVRPHSQMKAIVVYLRVRDEAAADELLLQLRNKINSYENAYSLNLD